MTELDLIITLADAGFTGRTFKPMRGREGPGYEYRLLQHGKPVATVTDWGDGAEVDIHWANEFVALEFTKLVRAMPKFVSKHGELTMNVELALGLLAEAVNAKRSFAKKTVFYVDDRYVAVNVPLSPRVVEYIGRHHPGAVVLNNHPAFA